MKFQKLTKTQVKAIQKKMIEADTVKIRLCCSNTLPTDENHIDINLTANTDLQLSIDFYIEKYCNDGNTGKRIHFYKIVEV